MAHSVMNNVNIFTQRKTPHLQEKHIFYHNLLDAKPASWCILTQILPLHLGKSLVLILLPTVKGINDTIYSSADVYNTWHKKDKEQERSPYVVSYFLLRPFTDFQNKRGKEYCSPIHYGKIADIDLLGICVPFFSFLQ